MSGALQRSLERVADRLDLVLVALLVAMIMMMILPLPSALIDVLIAANMAFTVILLMVGVYLKDPLEFSTLPAVILISTVFRLSLSIATTRLILLHADAGEIIKTFGEYAIAGNVLVGLVIFSIITVVQFVVIAKGAERIAEVCARFTLDALPGKQMSIDSDLRAGDIDQIEGRRRRKLLEKESQLYGAMDGAMKFVKGDAIAGIVIIAVNLIGGLLVGTMQHGMPITQAFQRYSLLTIGDGLVTQIPALFIAITAGTIITRVTTDEAGNLATDIARQLVRERRTLPIAAVVLMILGFVPGFPTVVFASLSAGLLLIALVRQKLRQRTQQDLENAASQPDEPAAVIEPPANEAGDLMAPKDAVVLGIGTMLHQQALDDGLQKELADECQLLFDELGVRFPVVPIKALDEASRFAYRLQLDGVPVVEGELPQDRLLLTDAPEHLELLENINAERGGSLLGAEQTLWVDVRHQAALQQAKIGFMTAPQILTLLVRSCLFSYAGHFIGVQETMRLLNRMTDDYSDLLHEVQRVVPVQRMAEVFRRLLNERVSIRNMRAILEALLEWGAKEEDATLLAEYVRSALKRQICYAHAGPDRSLPAHILEHDLEDVIRRSITQTDVGSYLALPDDVADDFIGRLRAERAEAAHRSVPIVLTSMDIRRFVRHLLERNGVDLPVLSFQELAPEFTVHPISTIGCRQRDERSSSEAA